MNHVHIAADNTAKFISFEEAQLLNWEGVQNCRDWKTIEDAERVAELLNKSDKSDRHLAIDNGANVWPRYDVIEIPQVGEPVSRAFNGDYYPAGFITKISKSLKIITTDTGSRFFRRKQTGKWVESGTWSMVHGHKSELNPSF